MLPASSAALPAPDTASEWLLILRVDGQELILGERHRRVLSGADELEILGYLPDMVVAEAIRMPGDTTTARSLSLSLVLPAGIDPAALPRATGELSRWIPGTDLSRRRAVLAGRLRDPEWGEDGEPVAFTLEDQPWQGSARHPSRVARVDGTTWPDSIDQLQEAHLGALYPTVIGRPGAISDGSRVSATPARWVWHEPTIPGAYTEFTGLVLVVAGHHVSAERCYLICDEHPGAWRAPVFNGTDGRGNAVAFVPWYATISGTEEDYAYDPGGSYASSFVDFDADPTYGLGHRSTLPDGTTVSTLTTDSAQPQFWVAWDDEESINHGGLTEGGRLIRSAGDVLAWLLRRSGRPVDVGSVAAAAPFLRGFRLDFGISSDCSIWEFVSAHLLPILPISISAAPAGWRVDAWRWEATPGEAVVELEAGAEVSRVSAITSDTAGICNRFRLQFSRAARTGRYTEEVELSGDPYDPDDLNHEFSAACRRSADAYGNTDEEVLVSDIVYDHSTARLILRHMAAARALPRLRVRYRVAERLVYQLRPGDVVRLTDAALGWTTAERWLVEEIEWGGGSVVVGLIRAQG